MVQMYQTAKALREHVMAPGQSWSMNETILAHGQATADNIPAQMAQIMYFIRISEVEEAEHIIRGLDHFAEAAASLCHCTARRNGVRRPPISPVQSSPNWGWSRWRPPSCR